MAKVSHGLSYEFLWLISQNSPYAWCDIQEGTLEGDDMKEIGGRFEEEEMQEFVAVVDVIALVRNRRRGEGGRGGGDGK